MVKGDDVPDGLGVVRPDTPGGPLAILAGPADGVAGASSPAVHPPCRDDSTAGRVTPPARPLPGARGVGAVEVGRFPTASCPAGENGIRMRRMWQGNHTTSS